MSIPQPYDTGLTEDQLAEAFRRALGDMTDEEIEKAIATAISLIPKGLVYRGAYNYFSELPTNAKEGEVYTVKYKGTSGTEPDGNEYAWGEYEGTLQWIPLGVDSYTKKEIDEQHETIKSDILSVQDLIKLLLGTSYTATTSGTFTANSATTGGTNRIRTDEIPVKAGDVIEITNGSLYHMCAIWKDSISASNVIRNDSSTIFVDERIAVENDGIMVVAFRNKSNTALSPDDFDGSVTLYRKIA